MTNYDTLKEYEAHKEPLPSYEEYQDIIQQNVNQEAAIETYIEDIKRLQEQIKEANELIKDYVHDANDCFTMGRIIRYKEKWGVK